MTARSTKRIRNTKRFGSTTPRIYTAPLVTGPPGPCGCGCALTEDTTLGFDVVEFATDVLGIELMPWQRWWLIHALETRDDGTLRFRTVVLLVARQNGKSTLLQVLALWFMYVLGVPLVIGTAQDLDTAEDLWEDAVALAEAVPELEVEISKVVRVNGKKTLRLRGGPRYRVRAANRRGGRGASGNLVLLDELREHQSWDSWAAVTKTTRAQLLALLLAASNAGDASSIVLRFLRSMAHRALGDPDGLAELEEDEQLAPDDDVDLDDDDLDAIAEDSLGIFEWSAPPGCSILDRDGWAQANPALGYRITERTMAAEARGEPEWVFRPEALCQWIESARDGPFPPGAWEASRDTSDPAEPDSTSRIPDDSPIVWCVHVSWDRSTAYVGLAGWRTDGLPQVEVATSRTGIDWVVDWFTDPRHPDRATRPIVIQSKRSPASGLVEPLREAGLDVVEWNGDDLAVGTGEFYDRVRAAAGLEDPDADEPTADTDLPTDQLRHVGQPLLNVAAANAATRPVGDAWLWDLRRSSVDIAPLQAVTGALWGLLFHLPDQPSVYEDENHSIVL